MQNSKRACMEYSVHALSHMSAEHGLLTTRHVMYLSCSVTLENKGTLFGKTIFSGAATKKKEKGCH